MQTPFEAGGSEGWTSLEQCNDFLHALASASDRAEVVQLGRSLQGRHILALAIGDASRLRSMPMALHIAGQHGNERPAIECAIAHARDLTLTEDPDTLAYLDEAAWLIVPMVSPDTVGTKWNVDGIDLNRDHANRTTPEARVIARMLHTFRPTITIDSHAAYLSYDIEAAPPTSGLGNHRAVVDASRSAISAGGAALVAQGRTFNEFAGNRTIRETLRNTAAYSHSATVLLEVNRDNTPAQGIADAKVFLDAVQAHHTENLSAYIAASGTSRHHLAPPLVIDLA